MASITIQFPDAQQQRIVDALCLSANYNAATDGTKAAFAKKQVIQMVKDRVAATEREQARLAALAAVPEPATVDVT
jgi:hypothetical protein